MEQFETLLYVMDYKYVVMNVIQREGSVSRRQITG